MELLTFGHGTASQDELVALIGAAKIAHVVDVRSVPRSRRHPHVWSNVMATWVPEQSGAAYTWEPELGGFRRAAPDSHNTALRHPAFRGYADYMETPEFAAALARLLNAAHERRTAIMCSETLWWRCHRRLIADAAVLLHGVDVTHWSLAGRPQMHVLTEGVRRAGEVLRYDVTAAGPPTA